MQWMANSNAIQPLILIVGGFFLFASFSFFSILDKCAVALPFDRNVFEKGVFVPPHNEKLNVWFEKEANVYAFFFCCEETVKKWREFQRKICTVYTWASDIENGKA